MEAEIEVIHPGLFSTIQDSGRFGYLKYGVPMSGAMDSYSAKIANMILNNPPDAAILEMTQMGPKLKFHTGTKIAISGADISARINGNSAKLNTVHFVSEGDVLSFGKPVQGTRAYLAVSGGFQTEKVLGSRSWFEGITSYYLLKKGVMLAVLKESARTSQTFSSIKVDQDYFLKNQIDVYEGPEYHLLKEEEKKKLFEETYNIDQQNNRMAIQLKETLKNTLKPIITGPVLPGTVQLTPSGTLIVLMKDCQTTGGYPRILQLSSSGMDIIAQKSVREQVKFNIINL